MLLEGAVCVGLLGREAPHKFKEEKAESLVRVRGPGKCRPETAGGMDRVCEGLEGLAEAGRGQ